MWFQPPFGSCARDISHFSQVCSKYLTLPTLLLLWPLTTDLSPALKAGQSSGTDNGLVIHEPPEAPARAYWFLFPQSPGERGWEKIKNIVSLQLNKDSAWGDTSYSERERGRDRQTEEGRKKKKQKDKQGKKDGREKERVRQRSGFNYWSAVGKLTSHTKTTFAFTVWYWLSFFFYYWKGKIRIKCHHLHF